MIDVEKDKEKATVLIKDGKFDQAIKILNDCWISLET